VHAPEDATVETVLPLDAECDGVEPDPLYDEAVTVLWQDRKAAPTPRTLQRRFRLGPDRAERLYQQAAWVLEDQLEEEEVVERTESDPEALDAVRIGARGTEEGLSDRDFDVMQTFWSEVTRPVYHPPEHLRSDVDITTIPRVSGHGRKRDSDE
jgi:hypothetical protein